MSEIILNKSDVHNVEGNQRDIAIINGAFALLQKVVEESSVDDWRVCEIHFKFDENHVTVWWE